MPKIPESSAIQMPRAATPGMIPEMVGQRTVQRTMDQLFQLGRQYKEMQQRAEVVRLSTEMESGLLGLQQSIERNPDIKTAEAASQLYAEGAKEIVSGAVGQSNWKSVQTAVGARGASTALRGTAAVSRVGYAREVDASRAVLDESAQTGATRYALAEDDVERAGVMSRVAVDIEMNPYIGDVEKGKRLDKFNASRVSERTIYLSNEGRFPEARAYLEDPEVTSVLDPTDIYSLTRTINIAENHASTLHNKLLKAEEDAQIHRLLNRLYNPENPEDVPSVPEILSAGLPRIVTEHFIEISEKKARGEDANYLDENLANKLYRDVHTGQITDFSQLVPYIGNGLPREEAEKLRLDIDQLQNPQEKATTQMLAAFYRAAEGTLDKTTMFFDDPKGPQLFYEFRVESQKLYKEGLKEGKSPHQMLDPTSPDYIGKLLNTPYFTRTDTQILEEMGERFRAIPEPGSAFGEARKEKETPEQYLERVGK